MNTVPGFAYDRIRAGLPMSGVAVVDRTVSIGEMIDELQTAAECGASDDFRDRVVYFPL